jgi:hypothetical protein
MDGDKGQNSHQAMHPVLCAECEKRFDGNGESWMLRNLYRGHCMFRLRETIELLKPIHCDANDAVYSASSLPREMDKLIYFCSSVFWRASIRDWQVLRKRYEAIELGPYQEQFRKYLLGKATFPENASVTVVLSKLRKPVVAFNFPTSVRIDSCRRHTLHIPGITFQLAISKDMAERENCILRSPWNLIFVSHAGDARVQRELLRLMGKTTPKWGEYR